MDAVLSPESLGLASVLVVVVGVIVGPTMSSIWLIPRSVIELGADQFPGAADPVFGLVLIGVAGLALATSGLARLGASGTVAARALCGSGVVVSLLFVVASVATIARASR